MKLEDKVGNIGGTLWHPRYMTTFCICKHVSLYKVNFKQKNIGGGSRFLPYIIKIQTETEIEITMINQYFSHLNMQNGSWYIEGHLSTLWGGLLYKSAMSQDKSIWLKYIYKYIHPPTPFKYQYTVFKVIFIQVCFFIRLTSDLYRYAEIIYIYYQPLKLCFFMQWSLP